MPSPTTTVTTTMTPPPPSSIPQDAALDGSSGNVNHDEEEGAIVFVTIEPLAGGKTLSSSSSAATSSSRRNDNPCTQSYCGGHDNDNANGGVDVAVDWTSPWPLRSTNCRHYRFDVEVQLLYSSQVDSQAAAAAAAVDGPSFFTESPTVGPTSHTAFLTSGDGANATLTCLGQRLLVRGPPSSSSSSSSRRPLVATNQWELHPRLREGDVLRSINGRVGLTAEELYVLLCRRETLHLEVLRRKEGVETDATWMDSTDVTVTDVSDLTWDMTAKDHCVDGKKAANVNANVNAHATPCHDDENDHGDGDANNANNANDHDDHYDDDDDDDHPFDDDEAEAALFDNVQEILDRKNKAIHTIQKASCSMNPTILQQSNKKDTKIDKESSSDDDCNKEPPRTLPRPSRNDTSANYVTLTPSARPTPPSSETVVAVAASSLPEDLMFDCPDDDSDDDDNNDENNDDVISVDLSSSSSSSSSFSYSSSSSSSCSDTSSTTASSHSHSSSSDSSDDDNDDEISIQPTDTTIRKRPKHLPTIREQRRLSPTPKPMTNSHGHANNYNRSNQSNNNDNSNNNKYNNNKYNSNNNNSNTNTNNTNNNHNNNQSTNNIRHTNQLYPPNPPPIPSRSRPRASSQSSSASSLPPSSIPIRKRPADPSSSSRIAPAPTHTTQSTHLDEAPSSLSRLWPDPSDAIKALTRWRPPRAKVIIAATTTTSRVEFRGPIEVGGKAEVGKNERQRMVENPLWQSALEGKEDLRSFYGNADDLMTAMARPLLVEGLSSINGDYHAGKLSDGVWDRDTYTLTLTKLTEVTPIFRSQSYFDDQVKMYEAQFSLKGETRVPPSNLCELYCMHTSRWKTCKFGIVAHDFPTSMTFRKYSDSSSILKVWITVSDDDDDVDNTGWLSRKEFHRLLNRNERRSALVVDTDVTLTLMSVGSTTNIVRQYEAIKAIPYLKPHLQNALFTSRVTLHAKQPAIKTRPTSVPADIWSSLRKSHNSYQLSTISNLLTGSCRENVSLIQGPPGTGKSSTIVGLVTALLSGKAPLPGKRQSGCLIHAGKTMGVSLSERLARNRILVCAATNQAVDTLAWKIKQGSLGPSGKVGDFAMARFGSLPWELSRDSPGQKPENLSEMEEFLYEINVDRKANDASQGFWNVDGSTEETNDSSCWESSKSRHHKSKKRRRVIGHGRIRSQILASCHVVVTTLSGAGSKAFIDAVCRDPTRNDSEFDAVIIDEACQASEPESLIPFKYNPTTVTLVGDPQQLPVLTLSGSSSYKKIFERSLFERLQKLNWPTIMLRHQYRMHEDIAAFPSEQFYSSKLITPKSIKSRSVPWSQHPCFPTVAFWDVHGKHVSNSSTGHGFKNEEEADFIMGTILSTFSHTFMTRSDQPISVGVISFYKDQVKLLRDELAKIPALNTPRMNVKIATVDGFQGCECDIIILSCVRSHSTNEDGQKRTTVGFLSDYRRVNVALTRAKFSLWIVGNSEALRPNPLWDKLIDHMDRIEALHSWDDFRNTFAHWQASRR